MRIQVVFKNPLLISSEGPKNLDKLKVLLLDPLSFISEET